VAALALADARIREGCYDCLLEARDIYQRVAVGKARPIVLAHLFEAEVLIYARETRTSRSTPRRRLRARAPPPRRGVAAGVRSRALPRHRRHGARRSIRLAARASDPVPQTDRADERTGDGGGRVAH
jgi:hypothetical protein